MSELKEGEDYFLDEKGLLVFTEKYLLQRGTCCGNGCRNCPFNYKNVSEPKKTELLLLRENEETKK